MQLVSIYYLDFMVYMEVNIFEKVFNGLYQFVDYIM